MFFVYILVGWEGSVADSSLYEHSERYGGLSIPDGKYWIADAGFASCNTLLVPYCNVRYHLLEWQIGNKRSSCFLLWDLRYHPYFHELAVPKLNRSCSTFVTLSSAMLSSASLASSNVSSRWLENRAGIALRFSVGYLLLLPSSTISCRMLRLGRFEPEMTRVTPQIQNYRCVWPDLADPLPSHVETGQI